LLQRVIDLWHGTILSQDGALQLLQIIDYICDWARDVYRINILRCLAGGEANLRDLTPAYTNISSQMDDSDAALSSSTFTSPSASPEPSPLIDLTQDDTMMEDEPHIAQYPGTFESLNLDDCHPLLRFSKGRHNSTHWTRNATIRHSDLVLFSFRHFAIPEELEALKLSLRRCQPDSSIKTAARNVLQFIAEELAAATITMDGISQLENLWTQTEDPIVLDTEEPIRAWFSFQTFFRSRDWQLVRLLSCVTCTQRALEAVATIADANSWMPRSLLDWTIHRCPCLFNAVLSLRSLCGKDSAAGAIGTLALNLKRDVQDIPESHFQWAKLSALNQDECDANMLNETLLVGNRFSRESSKLTELLPGRPASRFLSALLRAPTIVDAQGAILLKKPPSWPEECPTFCLLVLGESNFDDEPRLAGAIKQAMRAGATYGIRVDESGSSEMAMSDEVCLNLWIDILMGKMPVDAAWPL
jgi:hypothetical protein